MALGRIWCEEEVDAAAASKLHQAPAFEASSTLVGLVTASVAITLALRQPPPRLDNNTYLLALAGAFFAAVTEVITVVVCVSNSNHPLVRRAAGTKLMYASIAPLAVVVGLSVASLLW